MATLAERVKGAVSGADTYSLMAGRGSREGAPFTFPVGVLEGDRRDYTGRVVQAWYIYADGSRLVSVFTGTGYELLAGA